MTTVQILPDVSINQTNRRGIAGGNKNLSARLWDSKDDTEVVRFAERSVKIKAVNSS